jgi:trehalose/maltose transport system substrate-binding protein
MGGPPLLNDTGAISVNAPEAMQTLRRVKSWIGDIAPPEVTTMNNETARLFFQSGNALFMRNWPYAWAISQQSDSDLVGKVGVTTLLAGPQGPGAGTQGGWYLGVSRHSEHPEIAAHLLLFMTSQNEQLQRALFQSQNPTRPTLYSDPDIRSVSEFFQTVYGGLQSGLNRPNAPLRSSYVHVSNAWSDALNIYLSQDQDDPVPLFNDLQVYLERLERRDW